MNDKRQNVYKIIMLVIITVIITLLVSSILMYNFLKADPDNIKYITISTKGNSKLETEINKIRAIIDKYYIGNVDEEKVIASAIKGYVEGLGDEHSTYMTQEEWNEYRENALGNYTGLGVYLQGQDSGATVVGVIKNSAAEKYGLQPDDIIIRVDEKVVNKETLNDVTNYIKNGKEGTEIKLQIQRAGEELTITAKRELVRIVQVNSQLLSDSVGYIQFISFDEGIADDFKQQCESLKQQGATSLIIDVRNNGGGILSEAFNMLDAMLPKEATMLVTQDKENKETVYKAEEEQSITMPVVVLINDESASASEVLAGALQDNNRATIVGTKSYGKGTLQDVLRLQDGSALKLTTNEFFTPSKNKINGVGITPDKVVEKPEEYKDKYLIPQDQDTQLHEAIKILQENH